MKKDTMRHSHKKLLKWLINNQKIEGYSNSYALCEYLHPTDKTIKFRWQAVISDTKDRRIILTAHRSMYTYNEEFQRWNYSYANRVKK